MAEQETSHSQAAAEGPQPSFERLCYKSTKSLSSYPPSFVRSQRWRTVTFADTYESPLDRVNVLDGHTGSVSGDWSMQRSRCSSAMPQMCQCGKLG